MPEQLLKPIEVARRLGISKTKFYEIRPRLLARGMKQVTVGNSPKYLESSLDKLILQLADSEGSLTL